MTAVVQQGEVVCVDTQVHVAVVYRGSPGSWHDAGCCNSVKVETGSAVQGRPQQVASVNVRARQMATLVVVVAATRWRAVWQAS